MKNRETKIRMTDLAGETLDVQDKHPDIVKKLTAIANKYRKELGDELTNQQGEEVRPAAKVKWD